MERDNIRAAIQIEAFDDCKEAWKGSSFYDGSVDFFTFMTTPSPEREMFVKTRDMTLDFSGSVLVSSIK